MIEIPEEIKKEVYNIVNYLEKYDNKDNLSWITVYKKIIKELEIAPKGKDNILLSSTIRELTNRGYDIISEPFKLEKFR